MKKPSLLASSFIALVAVLLLFIFVTIMLLYHNYISPVSNNKSLKEISVTDICETAKINRSTFYEKFSDLPVLSKAFSEEVEKQAAEYPHNNEEFSWVFDYVKANKVKLDRCLCIKD